MSTQISRTELSQLIAGQAAPILIDVSPQEFFEAEHLVGAKNCCVYDVNFLEQVAGVVSGKDGVIVVYGSGACSMASLTAAEKLERAGYTNVRDFSGGISDWSEGGLALERGAALLAEPEPRAGRHEIDVEKSRIGWTGRNINGAHTGTLRLKEGWIDVAGDHTATGEFTVEMESMENSDLADSAMAKMLIKHLKSDDFFDTVKYPIAKFALLRVTTNPSAKPGNINAEIDGTLTLKGVTQEISFPAIVEGQAGGGLHAEAHFDIDRTRWNVLYGSGKFYEWLGKHLVHDTITLSLSIATR